MPVLLLLTNALCLILMGADKRRARRGMRRIPERTLFLSAGLFGALGGVIGMAVFRHKTRHLSFRIGFPAMLAAQILILIALGYAGVYY